jgi:pyruvate carboxylase subunit B
MWHMLKGTSYVLVDGQGVEIDYEKILLAEEKFKECMEKYFMPPEAQATEPLVCLSPMPGGALTANTQMMRDNKCLHRYPEVIKAMREVVERGGFGTSVTPVSQFYFQQAFANVMQGPWEKITDGYGKMVLGYFGKTPSQPDPEIVRLAAEQLKLPPTTESVVDINRRTKKDKAGFAKIVSDAGLPATDENIFIVAMCGDKGLAYLKGDRPLGIRYNQPEPKKDEKKPETPAAAAPAEGPCTVVVNGHAYQVDVAGNTVTVNGHPYQVDWLPAAGGALAAAPAAPAVPAVCINSPMPGSVVRVEVQIGQPVQAGDVIVVLESMKMEIPVKAVAPGVVSVVFVKKGDVVETGQPLAGLGGTPAAAAPMPVAPMHVQTAPATAPAPRAGTIRIAAPMPAAVMRMEVQVGQPVKAGDVIVVLEAMKMEIPVKASVAGTVKAVHVRKGDVVETGQLLVEM